MMPQQLDNSGVSEARLQQWMKEMEDGMPQGLQKWMQEMLLSQQKPAEASTVSCSSCEAHHYSAATAVEPKGLLQDCPHADNEGISNAFSPTAVLGIRSLPNALRPNYRQQLFLHLLQAAEFQRQAKQQQQQRQESHSTASCSSQEQQASAGRSSSSPGRTRDCNSRAQGFFMGSFSASTKTPHRYSPMGGYFSTYGHISSEFERAELLDRFARVTSKLAQVSPESFVVRGCPLPLPHTTTFAEYDFHSQPFQEVDHMGRPLLSQQQERQELLHGAFVPAGRSSSPEAALRGREADLLALLEKQVARDWPRSFLKVFTDAAGAVVVSFDQAAAGREGDISSYMNTLAKQGTLVTEFRLAKDPLRWGVVEADGVSVFYVLHPPWCGVKPELPEDLLGHIPPWTLPPHVTHPAHGFNRNPFGDRTQAGVYTSLTTRVFERTVDV